MAGQYRMQQPPKGGVMVYPPSPPQGIGKGNGNLYGPSAVSSFHQQQQQQPQHQHQHQQQQQQQLKKQPPQQPKTFSLQDFTTRYLPRTHNTSAKLTLSNIHDKVLNHLSSVRLSPRDVRVLVYRDNQGMVRDGHVELSATGMRVLEHVRAASILQKWWRGRMKRLERKVSTESFKSANSTLSQQPPPSVVGPPQRERGRDPRPSRRVTNLKRHLKRVSTAYHSILQRQDDPSEQPQQQQQPSTGEIEFMKLLNSEMTFKLSAQLHALMQQQQTEDVDEDTAATGAGSLATQQSTTKGKKDPATATPRMSIIPSGKPASEVYAEYAPGVLSWLHSTLQLDPSVHSTTNLLHLLRSGSVLCQLSVTLFPRTQCQLLQKGDEFTLHKIVFFLELCKTVGVKRKYLFDVADLFVEVNEEGGYRSGLIVLRTVCALERQARRAGYTGPPMVLVNEEHTNNKRRSKRAEGGRRQSQGGGHGRTRSRSTNRMSMMPRPISPFDPLTSTPSQRPPSGESLYSMYAYRWSRPLSTVPPNTQNADPDTEARETVDELTKEGDRARIRSMSRDRNSVYVPPPSTTLYPPQQQQQQQQKRGRSGRESGELIRLTVPPPPAWTPPPLVSDHHPPASVVSEAVSSQPPQSDIYHPKPVIAARSAPSLTPSPTPPPPPSSSISTRQTHQTNLLLTSEKSFVTSLTSTTQSLASLISTRQTAITQLCIDQDLPLPDLGPALSSPATTTIPSLSSLNLIQDQETSTSDPGYLSRLTRETHDYCTLHSLLLELVSHHSEFLSSISTRGPGVALDRLATSTLRTWITYAVLILPGMHQLSILVSDPHIRDLATVLTSAEALMAPVARVRELSAAGLEMEERTCIWAAIKLEEVGKRLGGGGV
ncbi:hypothetical protein DFS34DRAFT_692334 [Phlyctochytrium arcticum]|nr:hypothetical protein DFS34DRAFT_692334 [Phlyctochytrium arcticum]